METASTSALLLSEELENVNEKKIPETQNLLGKSQNEPRSQKIDQSIIHASQVQLKNNKLLQEEQGHVITDLHTKTEQLFQQIENESQLRTEITLNIDKIKKMISAFKNNHEILKQTLEQCSMTNKKIDKAYQESSKNLERCIKESDAKTKYFFTKNIKLNKITRNALMKYINFENEMRISHEEKDKFISHLKNDKSNFVNDINELEIKNKNIVHDINVLVEQKGEILNEFMMCKEKYEQVVLEHEKEVQILKEQISCFEKTHTDDEKSIKMLNTQATNYLQSLKEQTDFMSEIKTRNAALEIQGEELQHDVTALKFKFNEMEAQSVSESESLKNELTTVKNNYEHLFEGITLLENDRSNLQQEYEMTKDLIVNLEKKNDEYEAKKVQIENVNSTLRGDIEKERNLRNENVILIRNLQEEIDLKNECLEMTKKNYEETNEEFLGWKNSTQDEIDNIFIEKENLKSEIEKLLPEQEEIQKNNENKLRAINDETEISIKKIKEEFEKYTQEIEQKQQDEQARHSEELKKLNEQVQKLELQINEVTASKRSLEKELEQKIKEGEQLVKKNNVSRKVEDKNSEPSNESVKNKEEDKSADLNERKRSFLHRGRLPIRWEDSSDSSLDEYMDRSWKPGLINDNKTNPLKRKLSTQGGAAKKSSTEDLFESFLSSTAIFKEPQDTKSTKSRRHTRKPVF